MMMQYGSLRASPVGLYVMYRACMQKQVCEAAVVNLFQNGHQHKDSTCIDAQ